MVSDLLVPACRTARSDDVPEPIFWLVILTSLVHTAETMARKITPDDEIAASLNSEDGLQYVQRQIASAQALLSSGYFDASKYKAWKNTTIEFLIQAFGRKSGNITIFERLDYVMSAPLQADEGYWHAQRVEWLKKGIDLLGSCAEQLQAKLEIERREQRKTDSLREPSGERLVTADSKKVFVVHGRNEFAKKATFDFLRALGLAPMEWNEVIDHSGKGTPYVGEAIDAAFKVAKAVVVVLTGDDEVRLRRQFCEEGEEEREKIFSLQARPNVIFEAGLAFGHHPQNTILVQVGNMRSITDIAGLHIVRYSGKSDGEAEFRNTLATRLERAGCDLSKKGSDWLSAGDFKSALDLHNAKEKYELIL